MIASITNSASSLVRSVRSLIPETPLGRVVAGATAAAVGAFVVLAYFWNRASSQKRDVPPPRSDDFQYAFVEEQRRACTPIETDEIDPISNQPIVYRVAIDGRNYDFRSYITNLLLEDRIPHLNPTALKDISALLSLEIGELRSIGAWDRPQKQKISVLLQLVRHKTLVPQLTTLLDEAFLPHLT